MDEKEKVFFSNQGLEFKNIIAEGGFGVIYLMYSEQYHSNFAMKKIPKERYNQEEYEIMASIDHPNTINLYKTYQFDNKIYMLMEYCPNDLSNFLKGNPNLDSQQIKKYCYEVLIAIKACHDRNIAHSDIKPSNFLIDSYGRLKVCDFGLSRVYDGSLTNDMYKGTLYFMAPELLKKRHYNPLKADIWTIGVTFFYIATRRYPFYSSNPEILNNVIEAGVYSSFKVRNLELRQIISRCLDVLPEKRPTVDELLAHPYFSSLNARKLRKLVGNGNTMSAEIIRPSVATSTKPKFERQSCILNPSIIRKAAIPKII
ncbi:CAMK family protein kinase [Trichomonas vaginalis G3]|uniref:CAMK family protein kinase n=1 Tax=Trichomonas vaginalis (strain ATCC PRA-98 / G3) TaxID=412133 RepID=A2F2G4_TRIV3|nr:protein serine/threonine kinase protein [Trichomonas vaginalis G3]EAY00930.1 CAMK family protein kinase [Trichomonas vaginalis G3]KAI5554179.1 protein serine/threonine kinase protein [Trichomonas vaginalis G3]|eukprot:XP_001313859.1 CAMK family protein kinase [Trichomonas vaginalis G3]